MSRTSAWLPKEMARPNTDAPAISGAMLTPSLDNMVKVAELTDLQHRVERVHQAQLREAELNVAQARLEALRAEGVLRQRRVVSPVDGVITDRSLGPGEFRNDQASILTVAELDPLRVETFLPIALHGRVKVGDQVEILPEAPVGGVHSATVSVVDMVFDAASGTIGVRLRLPNPGMTIPAGIHCRARIVENPAR